MIHGIITLYDKSGIQISSLTYKTKSHRKTILKEWEKRIGNLMSRMFIQIDPHCQPTRITPKGQNDNHCYKFNEPEIEKIVRPPAKYDNRNYLE